MKPFIPNLKLVINKYLCGMYDYFPGVESSSDDVMLSAMFTISFECINESPPKHYV